MTRAPHTQQHPQQHPQRPTQNPTQTRSETRARRVATQQPRGVVPAAALAGRAPILPRTYVPRTRLGAALDGATQDGGITVLVAPAGAGKTLGVAGWLRDRGLQGRAVWVPRADTLTPEDLQTLTDSTGDPGDQRLLVVDDAHELSPDSTAWLDDMLDHAPDRLG